MPLPAPDCSQIHLPDEDATMRLGGAMAATLQRGDAVLLSGPLGAGKTALARAVITALLAEDGRAEDVPSPTFTLVQTYDTLRGSVWHVDLYRLQGPADCDELGLWDAFDEAITLIEWPNRLGAHAPARHLAVEIEMAGEGRTVRLSPAGDWTPLIAAVGALA